MSTQTVVGVGAGVLAAAAAAGAGYYFYGDKDAKKHRQAASKWAQGMKADVVKEAKNLKKLDQKAVARIVDQAAAMYQGARSVDRDDLRNAAMELKRNWKELASEVSVPSIKKSAAKKTAAKKAPAKKAAPKKAASSAPKKSTKRAK